MSVRQHIRMTASEVAMGRYMRAPDHPAVIDPPAADAKTDDGEDEFSNAFDAALLESQAQDGGGGGDGAAAGASAKPDGAAPVDTGGDSDAAGAGADGSGSAAGADAAAAEGSPAPAKSAKGGDAGKGAKKGAKAAAADTGADAGGATGGDAGDAAAAADAEAAGKDGKAAASVPDANADDIINRLAEAVAGKAKAPAADAPAAEAAPEDAPPLFNEQEQATLAKFKDDWPEEAKAVELMQRELGRGVIEYVFNQIAPSVREIRDLAQTLALRAHVSDLTATIGDYDDNEVDAIKKWVEETQPPYLQQAYLGVIDGGTAEEVSDLVGRYREATGTAKPPAGEQAPEPKPDGGETELSGAAKQAADALAPVGSKRSAVQSPEDAQDYDAGWAKWADMEV